MKIKTGVWKTFYVKLLPEIFVNKVNKVVLINYMNLFIQIGYSKDSEFF